mmetsp:Transcript_36321/g.78401  ORF Transcript_36321/g.78401 Transcript_36321/m.78401 type:complete len:438 (+) Transcript_36321:61-1374(+)
MAITSALHKHPHILTPDFVSRLPTPSYTNNKSGSTRVEEMRTFIHRTASATAPSRRSSSHYLLLVQLSLVLLSHSPLFANASEIVNNSNNNNDNDGNVISEQPINPYYFAHEIDFLAQQAMKLGDYRDAATGKKLTDMDNINEQITRARFIEKSLQIELEYIRKLRAMKKGDNNETETTTPDNSDIKDSRGMKSDDITDEKKVCDVPTIISDAITGATWPAWAITPTEEEIPPFLELDHKYDYDRVAEYGFEWMHSLLGCRAHAHDQKKPLYTPQNWNQMWKAFQDSTLFPFPRPTSEERLDLPYHVAYTTDGKGRGNFASRNIAKGELVNPGAPNTVFFLNAKSWYRFVSALPKMMACDVMEWAWLQDLTNNGNTVVCLNMDEAVFFNDGSYDEVYNMALEGKSSLDFYATVDIEKGEEVTYDYGEFEFDAAAMGI